MGSFRAKRPSSKSIMSATEVMGLLMEYQRKMVSSVMGWPRFPVGFAPLAPVDHLAVARNKPQGAHHFPRFDGCLHGRIDAREALWGKAMILRRVRR